MLPKSSLASRVIIVTSAPKFPAATAWLEPLPPGPKAKGSQNCLSHLGHPCGSVCCISNKYTQYVDFSHAIIPRQALLRLFEMQTATKPPLTSFNDCKLAWPYRKKKISQSATLGSDRPLPILGSVLPP